MPRVRLDIAHGETRRGRDGADIHIDTDVFATLSGERTSDRDSPPTIVRWLESWRR